MVPEAELPPATPLTSQVTPVFAAFKTEAVNCCDPPGCTAADDGAMLTAVCGRVTVTAAAAETLESATSTADTLTVAGLGTAAGAIYKPAVVIVPIVEFPPATPFTCH